MFLISYDRETSDQVEEDLKYILIYGDWILCYLLFGSLIRYLIVLVKLVGGTSSLLLIRRDCFVKKDQDCIKFRNECTTQSDGLKTNKRSTKLFFNITNIRDKEVVLLWQNNINCELRWKASFP